MIHNDEAPVYVGTSGWAYSSWKETYYPKGLPQRAWFDQIIADFHTVEVNASFYRLPQPGVFAGWRTRTPTAARIAVKASRYLTHIRRLRDPEQPVQLLLSRATELGNRLGPVLIQLPPDLRADLALLDAALQAFPPSVRLAVEPRHETWFTAGCESLLQERRAALVWADRHSRPVTPLWHTTDFGYLRMHEGATNRWPSYGPAALQRWAERVTQTFSADQPCYVYFNNDPHAAAPFDALSFASAVQRAGRPTSVTTSRRRVRSRLAVALESAGARRLARPA